MSSWLERHRGAVFHASSLRTPSSACTPRGRIIGHSRACAGHKVFFPDVHIPTVLVGDSNSSRHFRMNWKILFLSPLPRSSCPTDNVLTLLCKFGLINQVVVYIQVVLCIGGRTSTFSRRGAVSLLDRLNRVLYPPLERDDRPPPMRPTRTPPGSVGPPPVDDYIHGIHGEFRSEIVHQISLCTRVFPVVCSSDFEFFMHFTDAREGCVGFVYKVCR